MGFIERLLNENTSELMRQYFPKGADFSEVTDEQVQFVMDRLNARATSQSRSQITKLIIYGAVRRFTRCVNKLHLLLEAAPYHFHNLISIKNYVHSNKYHCWPIT
tara:strand:- start:2818 stop:3132 length:315 start_codon:yes stop_codon:yes gene_type:complete